MKRKKHAARFAASILLLAAISVVLWFTIGRERDKPITVPGIRQSGNSSNGEQGARKDHSKAARTNQNIPAAEEVAGSTGNPSAQVEGAGSPEELVELIRQFAATGASTGDLYRKLTAFGLKDRSWWRNSGDVSALLDLASDPSLPEPYRVVAMGIYLAAAPQTQLNQNSTAIQQIASGGSDDMASAVLQGMADRSIAPAELTKATLTSAARGIGAKCHAWYAARLTQKNDPNLALIAFAAPESPMTEATKVGFDYLASGSFQEQFATEPQIRQGVEESVHRVKSLQTDAGLMDLANGDAFIRSVPSILPADSAAESLLSVLRETPNPEMRLSAIERAHL